MASYWPEDPADYDVHPAHALWKLVDIGGIRFLLFGTGYLEPAAANGVADAVAEVVIGNALQDEYRNAFGWEDSR